MSTLLNILFTAVAVFFFGGRLFEIIALTDTTTGFIMGKAIVTSPLMMIIICVMAVCCGVIMFSGEYSGKKMKKMPVGIFGYAAGFFFISGGIISSVNCFRFGGFIGYHMIEVLGGIGLILLGISHIRGKKSERLPMLFIILLCMGVCLNSVVYEIKTIRDTDYMMRTLAGVTALLFFTMLFRNTIMPGKGTKMLLYITSQLNFAFGGVGSLAAVIGNLVNGTSDFPQMLYNLGFVVLGAYSLFVAFLISPAVVAAENGEEEEEQPVKAYRPKRAPQPEYTAPEMNGDSFRQMPTGGIDKAAIEMLFARKDEREKQREDNYRTVKNAAPEEYTQQVKTTRPVHTPEYTEERTTVISRQPQKAVYKGDGKKKTTSKVVYKAPK